MSTLVSPESLAATAGPSFASSSGDQRIVIRGVDRTLYNLLDRAIGEDQHIRLIYDGKDLELMTTGYLHERFKELFGRLMRAIMLALDLEFEAAGQATWKTEEAARGLESDLSYYFDPRKMEVVRQAADRGSNAPADYPAPDLAIEIDLSSPQVDRPAVYAALRVGEVWRFNGRDVVIEQLQPDGSYAQAATSRFLPLSEADIRRWLVEEDSPRRLDWERRLNRWAAGLERGDR